FLVVESGAHDHEIHLIKAKPQAQTPVVYNYAFENETLAPKTELSLTEIRREERPYSVCRSLRHSETSFAAWKDPNSGWGGFFGITFADSLEYLQISLLGSVSQFRDRAARVRYAWTKYLPQFFVQ